MATKTTIRGRADGFCERCGLARGTDYHHRRPRGMGGSVAADTNVPSNGLLLCGSCHRDIESERQAAVNNGWLVTQQQPPADIPVLYRGAWVYLDDLGNMQRVQETL